MKVKRLIKRNGIYYFRVKIPKDLKEVIGKREVHKSLKGNRYTDVVYQSLSYSETIDRLFDYLRKQVENSWRDQRKVTKSYI